MIYEIVVRFKHKCPFLRLTEIFTGETIYSYCSKEFDVIKLPGHISSEHLQKIKKVFPNFDNWRFSSPSLVQEHKRFTHVAFECVCDLMYYHTIASIVRSNGGLPLYPVTYKDGWEFRKLICFNEEDMKHVLDAIKGDVNEFESISVDDIGEEGLFKSQAIFMTDVIKDLSAHELNILRTAYEAGYYEIPRQTTLEKLAERRGVKKQAVDKVLRRAEKKLITSVVPYLYFREESMHENENPS